MIDIIKKEWNEAVGVPVHEKPTLIDEKQGNLMVKLLNEEVDELEEAINNSGPKKLNEKFQLISITDACCDILYLNNGTVSQYGLQSLFIKYPVLIPSISRDNIIYSLRDSINSFKLEISAKEIDFDSIVDSLELIQSEVYSYALTVDTPKGKLSTMLLPVLKEVHRSNLTKKEDGKFLKDENGKVKKGKDFELPNIEKFLF